MREVLVVGGLGLVAAVVGVTITHVHLRRLLAARGDKSWGVWNTLESVPLIVLGSFGVGAGLGWVVTNAAWSALEMALFVMAMVLIGLLLLLGILALRKFNE